MNRYLKKTILCLLILGLFAGLWGCAYRPRPAKTGDGRTLFRLGFSGAPDSLNPYTASSREAEAVFSLLYDTLFELDPETGRCVGALCTRYEVRDSAAGGRLWSITLSDDAFWQDGERVTASDVEFSLQSLKELSVLYGYPFCELLDVTGIAVEDDAHLSMVVWGREEEIIRCLASIPILPRHIWNRYDWMGYDSAGVCADLPRALREIGGVEADAVTLTGSGLYTFEKYENGVCSLRLNEGFRGGASRAQAVELRFGLEDTAAALREGRIDACWDMSLRDWQTLSETKGVRVTAGTGGELFSLTFNYRDSQCVHDPQLRRALERCVDRRAILLWAFGGGYEERGLLSPYSLWYYSTALGPERGYDPAEAARSLEAAGYRDKDGDGFREMPNGNRLALSLVYSSADPAWGAAAESIRSACAQAGLAVALRPMTSAALTEAVASGQYDLLLSAESPEPEPFRTFRSFYWDDGGNELRHYDGRNRFVSRGWNTGGYANQDYDVLCRELLSAEDDEALQTAVTKAGQLLYDDCAAIPIGFRVAYQAHSSVWYSLRADRTGGLFFEPSTLRRQFQTMDTIQ